MAQPELSHHIQTDLASHLTQEKPEIQEFYRNLNQSNPILSMELMAEIAPQWGTFTPVTVHGEIIAYTKPGLVLEPSQKPLVVMADSPTAVGKTTLVHELVKECVDCAQIIQTCTTRPFQPNEQVLEVGKVINANPRVMADVSFQYLHVTNEDFKRLSNVNFFVENKPMWSEFHYGIPRTLLEQAGDGSVPFKFLVVDEEGQQKVLKWRDDHKLDMIIQTWFLLPTNQTFQALEDRILRLRGTQASARTIDAIHDLYYGAGRTDVIIPYPFDESGIPHKALSHAKQLMNMLHPGVLGI